MNGVSFIAILCLAIGFAEAVKNRNKCEVDLEELQSKYELFLKEESNKGVNNA